MSILATSPTTTRHFDMQIATALGDLNAAIIVQQLHYWMRKKDVGVIIKGVRYIYNSFSDWVNSQFTFLSEWKFRKAMNLLRSLDLVKVIRYKSKQWNQTNCYSLDYKRLQEWAESQSIEISEMWQLTDRDVNYQTLEMIDPNTSYIESKNTNKQTKQERSLEF